MKELASVLVTDGKRETVFRGFVDVDIRNEEVGQSPRSTAVGNLMGFVEVKREIVRMIRNNEKSSSAGNYDIYLTTH